MAFFWGCGEPCLPELHEYLVQKEQVVVPGGRLHEYIHSSKLTVAGPEDDTHQLLEGGLNSVQTEQKHPVMAVAHGGSEGHLMPNHQGQGYLPVSLC